jgi:MFS family permease
MVINNMNEKQAGFRASLVFLLAIVGAPLGGYLTDRWRKYKFRARLLFPTITTTLAAILLYIALHLHHGAMQYVIFLLFGTTVTAFGAAAGAVIQDVVQAGLRAVSYAIAVVVQNFLGASFAPVIIGVLIDRNGVEQALLVLPFMLIVGAVLFYLGSRHYENDFKKVTVVELEPES